ncbi:MAG: hypothetical protein HY347_09465 [candidate division NC10 bacterium]|nr:hypothetical protein [candidate division NC10 bacterium]
MKKVSGAFFAMTVLLALSSPVWAAEEQKDKAVLDEILEILKQQGTITETQYQDLSQRAKKEEEKGFVAGVEKGRPFFKSADGNYEFFLVGRVQSDFHATEGDARTLTGVDLNDRFLIRRARLGVTGSFFKLVRFLVEANFVDGISLKYGWAELAPMPELQLRVGQYKEPFSLEELTSSVFIDFVERSLVNELVPAVDIGVMLHGSLFQERVSYFLGGFNGSGEDVADGNDEKDLAARLVLTPFKPSKHFWLKGLQLGGNVTWGDQDSAVSPQGRTNAQTGNRFRFFAPHPVRGTRVRWGGDIAWLVGPASLKAEYVQVTSDRDGLGPGGTNLDAIRARAWYVSATYLLTGEEKTSGAITPKRSFKPFGEKAGPGAWELALRGMRLDFNSDDPLDFADGNITNGITGGGTTAENGATGLTVGLNWYLNRQTRLMFNWTNYWYDNNLGTPFSFDPATKTLAKGEDTSWELLSRMQVWF